MWKQVESYMSVFKLSQIKLLSSEIWNFSLVVTLANDDMAVSF
jgi:hypothetical protein